MHHFIYLCYKIVEAFTHVVKFSIEISKENHVLIILYAVFLLKNATAFFIR